jgi:hypothetical protein
MTNATERVIGIVLTLGLFLVVLELVRRRRLMERYALLWLFASVVLLVLAAWRGLLTTLSHKVGIHYPPSALFVVAIGLGLILCVHFSLAISRLSDQNKLLAQRLAILQHRLGAGEEATGAANLGEADARGGDDPRGGELPGSEQPVPSAR